MSSTAGARAFCFRSPESLTSTRQTCKKCRTGWARWCYSSITARSCGCATVDKTECALAGATWLSYVCQVLDLYGLALAILCCNPCSQASLVSVDTQLQHLTPCVYRCRQADCMQSPTIRHASRWPGDSWRRTGRHSTRQSASSSRLIPESGRPRTICPSIPAPSLVPCGTVHPAKTFEAVVPLA